MTQVHGGKLVAKALKRHQTTHLFTLCGGHIQAIYDGCLDEGIRVVDVRHEQTAGHAADGYARVTGKPGVCAVTAGPGVTDVVTAAANAQRAGIPIIIIGGAGPRALADMGSLQDMNHVELMRSVTKWSVSVPSTDRLQEYIDSAFRIAQANVPGPVFLEMPLDLLMNWADDALPATAGNELRPPTRPGGDPASIELAAKWLAESERPMFIVGSQLKWSPRMDAVKALADAVEAPFYLNGMARGALPYEHRGLMTRSRKVALGQTDLCFVFGTPLDFRLEYGRAIPASAKLVQIDLDGAEIGRNRRVDLAIDGDSGVVITQLLAAVKEKKGEAWLANIRASRRQVAREDGRRDRQRCKPAEPASRLCRARKAIEEERHRHRRRRRFRGDGSLRAQARMAAAMDGSGAARNARCGARLRDGSEARATGCQRGARLR